ncbi:hypothetical protein [Peribacillus asahii]|uniref:hypothetical protein n=1 Tax=Peribacillus asahii TaxID=228899 RepID=UPI00207A1F69|nr:hypothetical protein [Peribacillus asahii]USK72651.1 hypothetical protein LIS76_23280 [Peribacillus asahii]USK72689.1 hypothetical protein LIS76_23865 [Peribacillus asahii]
MQIEAVLKMSNKIQEVLERETEFVDMEFIEKDGAGYKYYAYDLQVNEEVEILVSFTNAVILTRERLIEQELLNIQMPFNIWA